VVVIGHWIIRWNHIIELHMRKHNVSINEVIEALINKHLRIYLGKNNYKILARNPYSGRYLTIFLKRSWGNNYRLKTARDSTDAEKRLYNKKIRG
jgi:hypothetical protein